MYRLLLGTSRIQCSLTRVGLPDDIHKLSLTCQISIVSMPEQVE